MRRFPMIPGLLALTLMSAALASPQAAFEDDFFASSDGVRIHYLTAGNSGSWVVLIHGYTDNAERMFFSSGIAPALAENHRVVALDNRNHGQSDEPEPNGSGRATDVIELMDHLGIERAHIHGYSMGGGMTAELLASHPERFITAGFGGSGIQEADPELREQAASRDPAMPEPEGGEAAAFARLRAAAAARAASDPDEAPAPRRAEIDLTRVDIPVFAINGEFDSPYSKTQRMEREIRDFTNMIIPGKNHIGAVVPPMTLYVESIVRFIDSHDTAQD